VDADFAFEATSSMREELSQRAPSTSLSTACARFRGRGFERRSRARDPGSLHFGDQPVPADIDELVARAMVAEMMR